MSKFGLRLRELRKKAGLTQADLAGKFNISESSVGMYERGEREPSLELLNRFSEFFKVKVDYLTGRESSSIEDDKDFLEILNDPEVNVFFKDFASAPKERTKEMLKYWRYLKNEEKDRKPGDKQGE
ncbi:XRE family transcriptional regulator [Paenibacillus chitinolyticus]|uniref:Helix-turn-helix domain-containing protein n=1 Tax=Paenibacillus chitinolyticus TaxID=79263 RepID=A0A410X0E7_9BACL|nr:helix-turn-helix domain-containing protein [Paenibacillus chitinolyticus]MCY9593759.1 helix-turn-helix domain-containing protein [Paenibacillus chitinolyticus]MCY9599676.1 helix-turn-helix domain-containing protein [Paenibacillus chitinolyticus]QAV20149.1 XRE family transcriptional regulator [Paenibacillus chitinolyticus]